LTVTGIGNIYWESAGRTRRQKDETMKFYAVSGQDVGSCEACGWAWASIQPMVLARGDNAEEVLARAIERVGHDDVRVNDLADAEVDVAALRG
jgi:hypothetical protein